MAKKAIVGVKVEEERKEFSCKALGLEYRSKMKKIIEVLGNPECEAALDQNCGSTATKFRDLFAGIGTHSIVAIVWEFLKGGPR
jgi:hypothetical protein